MKKFFRTSITLVLLLTASFSLIAAEVAPEAEIQAEGTMLRKVQRGFLNVALSPFEISNQLAKEVRNDTFPPSWVAGLGRGAIYTVGRALVGVYEIVTFPLPLPAHYKPVIQPEFPWQLAKKPEF